MARHRLPLDAVQPEGAVAVHEDHPRFRTRELRGHGVAGAHAEGAERTRIHPDTRPLHGERVGRRRDEVAAIADDDGVFLDVFGDLGAYAERPWGIALVLHLPGHLGELHALHLADFLEPVAALARLHAGFERSEHLAGVARDAEVDAAVVAEHRSVEIHLHDLGVRVDGLAVLQTEIEGRAEDEDQVGLLERPAPGALEVAGVLGWQGATGHAVDEDGQLALGDQARERVAIG